MTLMVVFTTTTLTQHIKLYMQLPVLNVHVGKYNGIDGFFFQIHRGLTVNITPCFETVKRLFSTCNPVGSVHIKRDNYLYV